LPGDFAALSAPTVKDEVLDDVAAALRRLRLEEDLADSRIVVVGHSLGAMLARASRPKAGTCRVW
jgi:pimeloyl-ACP methyl ester carboxylesterase